MYLKVDSPNKASNLSHLMKNGNWIVLYYANWCGHCNTMKPEWQEVISRMKSHNNANHSNAINIADIESSHIDQLTDKPDIAGFPTIKMYNSGNEIANFEDERVADKIHHFAILNSKKSNINNTTINNTSINNKNNKIHNHKRTHHSKKTRKSKSTRSHKSHKSHKSRRTHKSHKSQKSQKSQKSHKNKIYSSIHRIPPKMIDLNMKNDLRMPTNISKIIGLD